MKCPKCDKKMKLVNKDVSFNTETKPRKKYKRTVYHCVKDDIWVRTEIPSDK